MTWSSVDDTMNGPVAWLWSEWYTTLSRPNALSLDDLMNSINVRGKKAEKNFSQKAGCWKHCRRTCSQNGNANHRSTDRKKMQIFARDRSKNSVFNPWRHQTQAALTDGQSQFISQDQLHARSPVTPQTVTQSRQEWKIHRFCFLCAFLPHLLDEIE